MQNANRKIGEESGLKGKSVKNQVKAAEVHLNQKVDKGSEGSRFNVLMQEENMVVELDENSQVVAGP